MGTLTIKKPLGKLVYGVECLVLITLAFIEYWSAYKGGLMKHLYFRKAQYMASFYSPDAITCHALAIAIILITTALGVRQLRGPQANSIKRCSWPVLLYGAFVLISFYQPQLQAILVYPYLLMALEVFFMLALLNLVLRLALYRLNPPNPP